MQMLSQLNLMAAALHFFYRDETGSDMNSITNTEYVYLFIFWILSQIRIVLDASDIDIYSIYVS
jgi:hypothetical protein